MTWRDRCRMIIAAVLRDTKGRPESEIKRALFDAYPFGEREYHPYKIWCSEIRLQRTGKRPYAKLKKPRLTDDEISALFPGGGA